MKFFRQIFTGRILCAFMALHMLNICIDTPDTSVNGKTEDLTYNKQESIIEFLFEKIFLKGNVIAEYDECDADDTLAKKISFNIDSYVIPQTSVFKSCFLGDVEKDTFHTITSVDDIPAEIHSPPPKV